MTDTIMEAEEKTSEMTGEEPTTSDVSPIKDDIPQNITSPVDSSSSHKEDDRANDNTKLDSTTEKVVNEEPNPADAVQDTDKDALDQSTPPSEIEVSKSDSFDAPHDGPFENEQGETITEEGVAEPQEPDSQERNSDGDGATSLGENATEPQTKEDTKSLTVTLKVEADVIDEMSNSGKETSSADDEENLNNKENANETADNVTEHLPSSAEPAVISPVQEEGEEKDTVPPMEDKEPPQSEGSSSVADRLNSGKQTSDPTTPSKPGTPETGISSATKGEQNLPSRFNTPHPPSRQLLDRPQTHASGSTEFLYDENKDFRTPDYEYSQTPLYSIRGDSGVRKTVSRGDSMKSVTFADDLMGRRSTKDEGVDEENEGESSSDEEAEKDAPDVEKDETSSEVRDKEVDQNLETALAADLFPTAVSEEKIEEAKLKRKERAVSDTATKEQRYVGLFGAPRFEERRTMEDVIGSKAREHFDRGCILLSELEHGQAIVSFDKAINLCPKEVRFYLMRAEAYLQMCDFQSAILNLKKACVLAPNNDGYYMRLAFVYYFQGQTLFDQCLYAEALESFSRASEMRPEVIGYHTRSVACLAALQRHGECLALVNKRLEVEQNNPDLYIMRARLHELFRNTSLCYYDLKDAIALDPSRAEASALMKDLEAKAEDSRNHAIRLQLQGKLKEAMHKITDAVETNPAVADYHLLRGALHRRLHDYNAAIDDFLLALDKTDHNEQNRVYMEAQRQLLLTYNDFAVECFLGGHFEEAIILLNKAIKGEKREKGLYINRGDCFFRLNELHFALADYHQALELDNSDWMIRSRIASIHSEFGLMDYEEHSYKEAEARFTVAIQHNPRVGSYYICRSKVRYMLENHAGARHDLLVTLHLAPNNEEILTLLPRLFPGKAISDIMKSKAARAAKAEVDNAVVTASPVKLPPLNGEATGKEEQPSSPSLAKGQSAAVKQVAFASGAAAPPDAVMPDLKACMDEIGFNTVLAKKKKKVSNNVKSLLHGRQSLWTDAPKLAPQPPARPYAVRGGNPNKNQSNIDPSMGWRSFSVGVGLK